MGIAKLANIPLDVILRAEDILHKLEHFIHLVFVLLVFICVARSLANFCLSEV